MHPAGHRIRPLCCVYRVDGEVSSTSAGIAQTGTQTRVPFRAHTGAMPMSDAALDKVTAGTVSAGVSDGVVKFQGQTPTTIPSSSLVEGSLRLGMSYLYAPGKSIDLSLGVGLTPDTPNLQFSVGLPFRYACGSPKAASTKALEGA